MKKRILSLLIVLVMCFALLPTQAFALNSGETGNTAGTGNSGAPAADGAETGRRADRLPSKDVFDGSKLIDNCGSVDVRIPDGGSVREVGNDVAAPDPVIGEVPQTTVIPTDESTEEGPVNTGAQTQRVGNRVAATARTLQKGAAGTNAQGDPCKLDLYISPSRDAGALAAYPSGAHYVGQTVTLVASANSGWHFMWWVNYETEESSHNSQYTTTLQGDCEWDGVFIKNGEYFIYVNRPLDMTVSPKLNSYAPGTPVTLIAPPLEGRAIAYEIGKDVDGLADSVTWNRIGDDGRFIMPDYHVWTRALYSYNVNVNCGSHGSYSLSPSGPYFEGDVVTLTMQPDQGYYASGIYGVPEDYTMSGNEITFTVEKDNNITLEFAPIPGSSVTFGTFPSGKGTMTHTLDEETGILTAEGFPSEEGWTVLYWMDYNASTGAMKILGTGNPFSFVPENDMMLVAVFGFIYPSDGGSVSGVVRDDGNVALTATASSGYTFLWWQNTESEILTYDATYVTPPRIDMVAAAAFQQGTRRVYTYDYQPDRGTFSVVDPQDWYAPGMTVELEATPYEGYALKSFCIAEYDPDITSYSMEPIEGNSFIMPDHDVIVMAVFSPLYTINATANPNNGGFAIGGGEYMENDPVLLAVLPNEGFRFVNWTENGTVVSVDEEYGFRAQADRSLTANFEEVAATYTVSASCSPSEGGTVTGAGEYTAGQTVTLTATPAGGYSFVNWTENGTVVSTDATYSFTASADRSLTANFERNIFTVNASANPAHAGSVSGAGDYGKGVTATLTAAANEGYVFVNWTENGTEVSTDATYAFTVTGDRTLTANFKRDPAAFPLEGEGTEESPYLIGTEQELRLFASTVNGGEVNAWAVLTDDIVIESDTWDPIGNFNNNYSGTFNGQFHVIKNLRCNDNGNSNKGLFGWIGNNGVVENLGVEGGSVSGWTNVGGVAANNFGTVSACFNRGMTVSGTGSVGGIVGHNSSRIEKCFNAGDVEAIDQAGGIAGYTNKEVSNCFNTGSVRASSYSAGGIAGHMEKGTVTNCYNAGDVSSPDRVGAVVGRNYHGSVSDSYFDSQIFTGSGVGSSEGTVNVTGLTTAQMTGSNAKTNMSALDFEEVWYVTSGYPLLRAFLQLDSYTYTDPTDPDVPQKEKECFEVNGDATVLYDGWYAVTGNVEIADRIQIKGDVNLILADGAFLNAPAGVELSSGNSLTIWGQELGTGRLTATGTDPGVVTGSSGIGGGRYTTCGTLTVNGGVIVARGFSWAAGIGGGGGSGRSDTTTNGGNGGTVTVNGGAVYAFGGHRAPGIGGANGSPGGAFIFNGGMVLASGYNTEAIGHGQHNDDSGTVTLSDNARVYTSADEEDPVEFDQRESGCRNGWVRITDAEPVPYLDDNGNGRECGNYSPLTDGEKELFSGWYVPARNVSFVTRPSASGKVSLILPDGVTVNADHGISVTEGNSLSIFGQTEHFSVPGDTVHTSGTGTLNASTSGTIGEYHQYSAIGGEREGYTGSISIHGGVVIARGNWGAGIGGGDVSASAGSLRVTGGYVEAYGGSGSAAIGGGAYGNGSDVDIIGGYVVATGSVYGATGQATPGIGSGRPRVNGSEPRDSGMVSILGGTVIAKAGVAPENGTAAQAIGVNTVDAESNGNKIRLGELKVYDSEDATEPVPAAERIGACHGQYVKITWCEHNNSVYYSDITHWYICDWCGRSGGDMTHEFGEPVFDWGDGDHSQCTATLSCTDCEYTVTETVSTTHEVSLEPTCGAEGKHRYTATFENPDIGTVSEEFADIPATGDHTFGEVTYDWSEGDHSQCTATHTCTVCGHTETETVAASYEVTVEPTCGEGGKRIYTATFENPAFGTVSEVFDTPVRDPEQCPGRIFTDMPKVGNWAHDPIDWAVTEKVTSGMTKTTFGPSLKITRGQVVTFLWRAAGSPEPTTTKTEFGDLKKDGFYYKAVLWAVEKGITKGMTKTTFDPGGNCTRGQIVAFMYRYAGSPAADKTNTGFTDVKNGAFYENAVAWAVEADVATGTSPTAFSPNAACTRAQTVTFLYRLVKNMNK